MNKWSTDGLTMLISCFQNYPILYNVKDADYYKREKKRNALEAICRNVQEVRPNTTVQEVKYKLKTLRVQFLKEYKKMMSSHRSGSGTSDTYVPTVWWFDSLFFLRDFIESRKSNSNVSLENAGTPVDDESLDDEDYDTEYLDDQFSNTYEDIQSCSTMEISRSASPVNKSTKRKGTLENSTSSLQIKRKQIKENQPAEYFPSCSSTEERPSSRLSADTSRDSPTPKSFRTKKSTAQMQAIETLSIITKRLDEKKETHNKWHSFGIFVGDSLSAIKNENIANKMKREIMRILMHGEEEDEATN